MQNFYLNKSNKNKFSNLNEHDIENNILLCFFM